MKILPSRALHRRRVPPPRLPRPDRPAADGRRGPRVPGRHARHPRQARRAGRPADRQPRLRRVLDEQVGRPAPGQPQVPRRRGGGRVPQLDPRRRSPTNMPYDQFVRDDPDGQRLEPARTRRRRTSRSSASPTATMENTTQLFLAVRFNCNKCHDHPFERWTQDQYYQTAAFFAQVGLKADPASKATARSAARTSRRAKPLFEIVADTSRGRGQARPDRAGGRAEVPVRRAAYEARRERHRAREQLAAWITSKDNPYFARSYVNRLWGYLFGVGIIEPLDDIRAGNPPTQSRAARLPDRGVHQAAASTCGT